jgi:hypothetical protein
MAELNTDHEKMVAVVGRLDKLIASLGSSGNRGSYANLQGAANIAQPLCTVAEQEVASFVLHYNAGFGAAAGEYQSVANQIVALRNAVAQTANIHSGNDATQAKTFDPLKGGDTLSVKGGNMLHGPSVTETTPDGNSTPAPDSHTTTLAPGEPLSGGQHPSTDTAAV